MRRVLRIFSIVFVITGLVVVPVFAQEAPKSPIKAADPPAIYDAFQVSEEEAADRGQPPGELIIADGLILRPLGLVACGVGLVGTILVAPWAATSNSGDRVTNQLLRKPFRYTFERPLGDVDN